MERPAFFGDKQFLTDEEITALASQTEAGLEAINNIGVGGYNTFWVEMGENGDNRTSLITYPENGRLPETQEGVPVQVGGLGPDEPGERPVRMVVGGIAKDGPEERFTRTGPYTVEYEFTVEDPATFKDRITVMIPMSKVDGQLYEYACHEGNYGMINILRGERMTEQREAENSQ